MKMRRLGKTGYEVSEIGLGTWQLGGDFGPIGDDEASTILSNASRVGVNFWDTADVYGNGTSEHRIGTFYGKPDNLVVATKVGRSSVLYPDKYTRAGLRENIEESARRLCTEQLALVQLHCVPREVLEDGEIFTWLGEFQDEGLIAHFGASVETIEEGLLCLREERLASLQIIFNLFRQDAAEELLPRAQEADVGVIVRLPLASGLLSGKYDKDYAFSPSDHRSYNREGEVFSIGETFSGIPFERGVELVDELAGLAPEGMPLAHMGLRWILDHEAVSSVITGVTKPEQIAENVEAGDLDPLPADLKERLAAFYHEKVRPEIRGDI